MPHLHFATLIFLAICAVISGCIDTIAGGGGLISVPALLMVGMPPILSLGTNKLQATFGSFAASYHFLRTKHISYKEVLWGVIYCSIGASFGTISVFFIHPEILKRLLPLLLLAVILYMVFKPQAGKLDRHHRMPSHLFFLLFGFSLGFYDGFFGPGTGSLWAISLVAIMGFNIRKATMHTKVYNFISNIISLIWFIFAGHIAYTCGLIMAVGQYIGARIGAHLVIHKGTSLIRPLFLSMVSIMTIVVTYKYYGTDIEHLFNIGTR